MPKNRTFVYQPRSREAVKEMANRKGGGYDDFLLSKYKKYKAKDGKNVVRIMPATWQKAGHYGYKIWLNYGIGPDKQAYLSLSKMKDDKDPIAEARSEAQREGDDKLIKDLAPRERVLVWVIDREAEDEGPQIWAMPPSVDKDILKLCYDDDTRDVLEIDRIDFDEEDKAGGYDLRFYKTGQMLQTEYDPLKMKLIGPKPLSDDEDKQAEWMEYIMDNPLPDCLQFYDYDYISRVFGGAPSKDEEVEARPRRTSGPVALDTDEGEDETETQSKRARPRLATNGKDDDEGDEKSAKARRPKTDDEDDNPKESIRDRVARRRREIEVSDADLDD